MIKSELIYNQICVFIENLHKSHRSGFRVESVAKDARGIDVTLYNDRNKHKKLVTVTLSFENGVPVNAITINSTKMKRSTGMLFSVISKFHVAEELKTAFIPFAK